MSKTPKPDEAPENSSPDDPQTSKNLRFADLRLDPAVLQAVDEVGYEAPSPIQAESIPPLLEGRDLLGQAQTGTGKTAAFALPILSRIDLNLKRPQALVLAPTRELAIQVAEAMQTYARKLKRFHVAPVYGGQSIEGQLRQLKRGVHVVVGTPGRIRDHLRRKTLNLDSLQTVVLDEADEMLRMGFLEEVEEILQQMPDEKQVALFSATMPGPIRKVAQTYLREPVEIKIAAQTATVKTVTQRYWRVGGMHKLDALTRLLEIEEFDAMLIFVRTKVATAELAEKLEARGFASAPLNGDMGQALRERTVDRLKKGQLDIVVATDVAARGLDVDRISHVINYDIPYDVEAYVHRIGRTARAGRQGTAILFVSPRERHMLRTIERTTRQTIAPMEMPSREDIVDRRVSRFKQTLSEALSRDLDFFENLVTAFQDETDHDPTKVAAALAYLAQKERPLVPPQKKRATRQVPGLRPSQRGAEPRRRRDADDRPPRNDRPSRDFGEREERPPRDRGRSRGRHVEANMERYRIEVGHDHGVQPGNIVGAISNEAGLDGSYIGHIRIFDSFSLVDLPEGMPREVLRHLKTVRIRGEALKIRLDEGPPSRDRRQSYDRRPEDRRPSRKLPQAGKAPLHKKKKRHKKLKGKARKKLEMRKAARDQQRGD